MEKKNYVEPKNNMAQTRIRTSILAGSTQGQVPTGNGDGGNIAEGRRRKSSPTSIEMPWSNGDFN